MTEPAKEASSELSAFLTKYKVPLLIGGGVLLVMYAMEPDTQSGFGPNGGPNSGPYQDPYYDSGPQLGSDDGSYDEWRRRQQEQDEDHERYVQETIREEQTCRDIETGEIYTDVPISVQCE